MNAKAKKLMDKYNSKAAYWYDKSEVYRLQWKKTKNEEERELYLKCKSKGQICGQATCDFESLIQLNYKVI